MRDIVVSELMTLDGVIEAPGDEPGRPHTGSVNDVVGSEQERYELDGPVAA